MQIKRKRGDTYPDKLTISVGGDIANLTGCSVKMTLNTKKNPPDNTTEVYQIDGMITDPINGVVEFAPTALQADQVGSFYYDIQLTDASGLIRTIVSGIYEYSQDITK